MTEGMSGDLGGLTGDSDGGATGQMVITSLRKPQFLLTAAAAQLLTGSDAVHLPVNVVDGSGAGANGEAAQAASAPATVPIETAEAGTAVKAALVAGPPSARAGYSGLVKQCRRCGIERPTKDFHRQQSRPDGLYSYCVFCASEYKQARKLSRSQHVEVRTLPVHTA